MQHPPQQPPTNQPYYPPSEIYQYDQPRTPTYAAQNEAPKPHQESKEIAIYYNQKLLTLYRRICKVLLIILSVLFIGLLFLVISSFIPPLALALGTPPIESGDILPIAFSFGILLIVIAALAWWVRVLNSISGPTRKPVLHVTNEGITIQNNILVRYCFIRWNQIETIYASNAHLKIRSTTALSSPSHSPGQLQERTSKQAVASLFYLDTPGQEILRQICETYASELSYYRIQFWP